jgi:hypothetical protein
MLQRYKSHKVVEGGRIQGISYDNDGGVLKVTVGGRQYDVPENFAARGAPSIGDYLVRYADGYLSWSTAEAFEEGYTLIGEAATPGEDHA